MAFVIYGPVYNTPPLRLSPQQEINTTSLLTLSFLVTRYMYRFMLFSKTIKSEIPCVQDRICSDRYTFLQLINKLAYCKIHEGRGNVFQLTKFLQLNLLMSK